MAVTRRVRDAFAGKRRGAQKIPVHAGSGNVYAELGYPNADEMLVKARLVSRIAEIIKQRGLTQIEAAKLLGFTQPKVSAMLRGRFRGFSERKLIDCLTSLGSDVQIVIKEPSRRGTNGKLTVVVD